MSLAVPTTFESLFKRSSESLRKKIGPAWLRFYDSSHGEVSCSKFFLLNFTLHERFKKIFNRFVCDNENLLKIILDNHPTSERFFYQTIKRLKKLQNV